MLLVRMQHRCHILEVFLLHCITLHMSWVHINLPDLLLQVTVFHEVFAERLETGDRLVSADLALFVVRRWLARGKSALFARGAGRVLNGIYFGWSLDRHEVDELVAVDQHLGVCAQRHLLGRLGRGLGSLDGGGHGLRTFLVRVCDALLALATLTIHRLARVGRVNDPIWPERSALALGLSGLNADSCFRSS